MYLAHGLCMGMLLRLYRIWTNLVYNSLLQALYGAVQVPERHHTDGIRVCCRSVLQCHGNVLRQYQSRSDCWLTDLTSNSTKLIYFRPMTNTDRPLNPHVTRTVTLCCGYLLCLDKPDYNQQRSRSTGFKVTDPVTSCIGIMDLSVQNSMLLPSSITILLKGLHVCAINLKVAISKLILLYNYVCAIP